jgi:electron transfer flavoprotein beta subunit
VKIAVCIKEVPSASAPRRLTADGRLDRSADGEMNPFDTHALEEAIRIRERGADVEEIVVVSMARAAAQRALTKALALGADRVVLLSDESLAGTCIVGTAHALAALVERQGADLVLLGQQAADADCYVMAAAVAENLRRPLITQAAELAVDGGSIRAKRQAEHGYDVISAPLPAVVSVSDAINQPRLPNIKAIMGAKKKPFEVISVADAGVDTSLVGAAGARTRVASTGAPPAKEGGRRIEDDGGSSAEQIVEFLAGRGVL